MSYDAITTTPPKWELRLANSKTFDDICVLTQARNRQVQLFLNKPGSFVFDLPLEDGQALLVDPVKTCVKAYRNGRLIWSGPVWSVVDSAPDNKSQVSCIGWFEFMNHRITLADLQYLSTDAGFIARDLYIQTLTAGSGADLPQFSNPSFSSSATGWSNDINPVYLIYFGTTYYFHPHTAPYSLVVGVGDYALAGDYSVYSTSFSTGVFKANNIYIIKFYVASPDGDITLEISSSNTALSVTFDTKTISIPMNESFATADWAQVTYAFTPTIDTLSTDFKFNIKHTESTGEQGWIFLDDFTVEDKTYDIPVTFGQIESTQIRDKTYPKFSNVGQEITNLSEIEAGFDFEVDPEDRTFNVYSKIGSPKNLYLGYNVGANNIKSLSVTQDASRMVNEFVAIGASDYSVADEESKQEIYGKFAETGTAPSENKKIILGAYANEEVALRSDPLITYDIVPMASGPDNVPQPFDDYNVGDIIYFSAKKGRIQIDSQAIRIFGMSVAIDDNGVETVSSIQTRADG